MLDWILGLGAFVLFFLYDWNRVFVKTRWMTPFFAVGNLFLAAVAIRLVWLSVSVRAAGWIVWLMGAVLFLICLIHTLYFALPFDSTYCREADKHKVCRTGVYSFCRHPGIWWFFGCFLCMGMSTGVKERAALSMVLSLFNLLYAWYQDRCIFVREFSDYEDYQRTVPFLIPKIIKGGEHK